MKGRYLLHGQAFGVPHECEAFIDDVYQTVRLGLIGGGQGQVDGADVKVSVLRAKQLIETYAHTVPLKETWDLAVAILAAKIEGYEPQKKSPPDPAPEAKPRKATTQRK